MTGLELKETCDEIILLLEQVWNIIEKEELENTQEVLDFLDKLNEYSIRN